MWAPRAQSHQAHTYVPARAPVVPVLGFQARGAPTLQPSLILYSSDPPRAFSAQIPRVCPGEEVREIPDGIVAAWDGSPRPVRGLAESKSHAKPLGLRETCRSTHRGDERCPGRGRAFSPAKGTVVGLTAQGSALYVTSRAQDEATCFLPLTMREIKRFIYQIDSYVSK